MDVAGCPVPEDVRVDVPNGVWLRSSEDGTATLGLLAPFVAFAGRVISVSFRPIDGPFAAGRSVATVETARLTGAVRTPVRAEVIERNEALSVRPRIIHDEPYGAGWFVRLRLLEDPTGKVPTAEEARPAIAAQIHERRVRCYAAMPDLEVYEIGAECRAILVRLDEELARRPIGDVLLLVVDDPTAPIEMARWSDRTGYPILEQRRADGLLHFLVRKVAHPRPRPRPAS
jgi:glycine cleavage system H protein